MDELVERVQQPDESVLVRGGVTRTLFSMAYPMLVGRSQLTPTA